MTIAVFGATGRTGLPFVEQAMDAGHTVRVLVRSPEKLVCLPGRPLVVRGDAYRELERVEETIRGTEAVVSVVGPASDSPPDLLSRVSANLIHAMRKYRVRRLLYMTGASVRFPQDRPGLVDWARWVVRRMQAGPVYQDQAAGVDAVTRSGLDWTVVRGHELVDGPRTPVYHVGHVGEVRGVRATRANVVRFFLRELDERKHIGDGPVVSDGPAVGQRPGDPVVFE